MSDTASHFKNRVMKTLERALRAEHRLVVASSPSSNDTCDRIVREVVRALKAILQEERRDIREWVSVVPAVQWALNTAYRERYASTPYHVMFGWAPLTSFSTLGFVDRWKVDALDARGFTKEGGERCGGLHKVTEDRVKKNRDRQRQAASRGQLPNFDVANYAMVARVRRPDSMP